MRSPVVIVLLAAMAAGPVGTTAVVLVRHQRGRRHAEAMRPAPDSGAVADGLAHLRVPLRAAKGWTKRFARVNRHEVLVEGRLYDVVVEEARGDTLHLWAYRDHPEEQAVARLAQLLDGTSRFAGLATAGPRISVLHLRYLFSSRAALRPPSPGQIDYAPEAPCTVEMPFYDIPHPPPRG